MYKDDQIFQVLLRYDFDLNRNEFDVPSYFKNHFDLYINDIECAAFGSNPFLGTDFCTQVLDSISLIKSISNKIVEISGLYWDGKIKDAFESAYTLFSSMKPYYLSRISCEEDGCFFRFRRGDLRIKPGDDRRKKKAEMFHIKDSKRNIIGACRFNIPGFPCLYLTSGFELGWFESGMLKQFSYCKMCIEESGENALRLIDLSNRPVDLLSRIFSSILNAKDNQDKLQIIHKYILNYIITYPLAAACSLKVKDRGDKFVEEYVIPQMFMNWIRESSSYDGIRYKSSLNTTLVQEMGAVNIVLPVKKFRDDGLCENLTSKITVSDIVYLDVNEDFKKYQQYLQDIADFKNELWNKIIRGKYSCGYVHKIIEICEGIIVTYNSIINGNQLNDVVLHQINCLADYVFTIHDNRESLIRKSVEEIKQHNHNIDEKKLQGEISTDFDKFYTLVINVIHKHAVFHLSHEDILNFEKI